MKKGGREYRMLHNTYTWVGNVIPMNIWYHTTFQKDKLKIRTEEHDKRKEQRKSCHYQLEAVMTFISGVLSRPSSFSVVGSKRNKSVLSIALHCTAAWDKRRKRGIHYIEIKLRPP